MDGSLTRCGQPCWYRLPKSPADCTVQNCLLFILPSSCMCITYVRRESGQHVKNILVEMGIYFQLQDDYLDCFGDPETIGKIGTDIEDFKCSWLVVKAMELCNEEQNKLLFENYGKPDPANVEKVKSFITSLIFRAYLQNMRARVMKN